MQGAPEQTFASNLDLIERVIGSICRRNCVLEDEAEDFASWAKLKLIDHDYAVLSKFQGRSILKTYLTVVLHNLFRDYRIQKWGKWRPSAKARRLGDVAVQLETLLGRDGFTHHEATEILRSNLNVESSRGEIEAMAAELPPRTSRRIGGEEAFEATGVDGRVEARVIDGEREELVARTESLLTESLAVLPAEDRLILRMHYQDGFTISNIAATMNLKPRPLYRQVVQSLRTLRRELERRGLGLEEVRELIDWEGLQLKVNYQDREAEKPPTVSV